MFWSFVRVFLGRRKGEGLVVVGFRCGIGGKKGIFVIFDGFMEDWVVLGEMFEMFLVVRNRKLVRWSEVFGGFKFERVIWSSFNM